MNDSNSLPTEIYKETSSLGRLLIKPVDKATAKEMIVKNHYSHKWNDGGFGVYNFGIFRADEPDRPQPRRPSAKLCTATRLGSRRRSSLIEAAIRMLSALWPSSSSIHIRWAFYAPMSGC